MPYERKGKHLNALDRIAIEDGLRQGENISKIARRINVSWSTVSCEIKKYRTENSHRYKMQVYRNLCIHRKGCAVTDLCSIGCLRRCAGCDRISCNKKCKEFEPTKQCDRLKKAPYVCNDCGLRYGTGCGYEYLFYDARLAQEQARWKRTESRRGVSCSPEELKEMVDVIKPLLKKGQSLEHIWQTHKGQFPVGFRTFYRYINLGVLDIINLELPKKMRYKARKKVKDVVPFRSDLVGKTYEDFCELCEEDQMSAVEMDCVIGKKADDKVILTLYFRRYCFQIMILLPAKTQGCVAKALDQIQMLCGKDGFMRHFKTILTDRGPEFLNATLLEKGIGGKKRCSVYYCDPMKSGQKGACEKNHVQIRRILPKGCSFENLTPVEVSHICSHVNSYVRASLGGLSPLEIVRNILPKDLLDGLGIELIPPDDVILKPDLLKTLGLR